MVIYEVHRGRELGGAWGGRDDGKEEEEEVLERRRKQSPLVHIGLLTQALTGALLFPPFHVSLHCLHVPQHLFGMCEIISLVNL